MILYKQLANYYDKFYHIKNYKMEVDFILQIFKKYKIKVRNILDVGCGTGSHDKLLSLKGYHVTGVDLNEEMLKIARKKVRNGIFIKGDMRSLDSVVSKQYDAVILLFNSIGYNTNKRDFRKTLKGVYNHLRKGGVFIFDLNTKNLIMRFMSKQHSSKNEFNFFFKDKKSFGFKHVETKIKKNTIEEFFDYLIDDNSKIISVRGDFHKLGLFTESEIKSMMRSENFKVATFYNYKFKPPSKKFYSNVFVGFKY
jgi:SAM-dependent methyltransferase